MTIFEKTMQACLQDGATSKKLAEKKNVKKTSKKTITERKSIRRKFEADEPDFDDDFDFGGEDDFGGDELGGDDFTDADTADEGYAGDVEDDISIKPDYEDDTAAVVDPEAEEDDDFLANALAALQGVNEENIEVAEDAIEGAEDGEEVKTDDYVGQNVYICPICGSTFFNDGELGEGDACPVCGETPEAFVACGVVEANDGEDKGEEKEEAKKADDEADDDFDFDDEEDDEEPEEDDDDGEKDKAKEEAYRRRAAMRRKAEARRRMEARRRNTRRSTKNEGWRSNTNCDPWNGKTVDDMTWDQWIRMGQVRFDMTEKEAIDAAKAAAYESGFDDGSKFNDDWAGKSDPWNGKTVNDMTWDETIAYSMKYFNASRNEAEEEAMNAADLYGFDDGSLLGESKKRNARKPVQRKAESRKQPEYMLNEKTFERHLCRFFAENYSNVDDVTITTAIMKEGKLGVGAVLTFKSGKKKKVPFVVEGFNMKSGVYSVKDSKNAFEAKSSKRPFKFKVKVERNIVSCEGIAYKFETKSEGKRVLVSGTTLTESKKKISKPSKFESDKKTDKKDDKKTDDKKPTKKTSNKSKDVSDLDKDQIKKICAIVDFWAYDIEEDGGRDISDMDERSIRYTKKDKENATKLGKLCPPMNINGGMSETTICKFLKDERPDLYKAIANCDDKTERQKIFKQIQNAAFDGDFKKKF